MFENRYLKNSIKKDLEKKMVFLGGPRQVGKTTLSKNLLLEENYQYLNWDFAEQRENILKHRYNPDKKLLIFDEIHKAPDWKNHIKGLYDVKKEDYQIMITGSARLDLYKKGGDSLMGRYHYFRMHPLSLAELFGVQEDFKSVGGALGFKSFDGANKVVANLMRYGGFPEPYFKSDEIELQRWQRERLDRLIKEDIRDVENISLINKLQLLADMLPAKVGSKLSINSLSGDLKVNFNTVKSWLQVLENFYYVYRVYPYTKDVRKSLRKEAKLFLWDWSVLDDRGKKFENLIGSHLLKFTHFLQDKYGHDVSLHYLRDFDGHEIDFLVTLKGEPWFAVEAKVSDKKVSKHIGYFDKKISIPYKFQVLEKEGVDFEDNGVRVMSASKFLSALV